jgi:hypothetical protein
VRKRPCHGEPVAIDLGFQLHQATHQEADHLGLLFAYDQQRRKPAEERHWVAVRPGVRSTLDHMTDGAWWDHWAGWMIARAREERPAPETPGSRRRRVLGPAPGIYVFEKV